MHNADLNALRTSLEKLGTSPLTPPQASEDLLVIFKTIQHINVRKLSRKEKIKISQLYENIANWTDLCNLSLVKAVHAFRKSPLYLSDKASLSSKHLEATSQAETELSSWKESKYADKQEAYHRIRTVLQKFQEAHSPLGLILNLSDLPLPTLPTLLFTDPTFDTIPVKINRHAVVHLPPSLTLGSLVNESLHRRLFIDLSSLLERGELGREGPLPHILSYLRTKDLKNVAETSKEFLPLLPAYTSDITILSQKLFRLFLAALNKSNRTWIHLTKLSLQIPYSTQFPSAVDKLGLIVPKCPNLQNLSLVILYQGNTALQHIAKLKNLKRLTLQHCHTRLFDGWHEYLAQLPHLTYLSLTYGREITDEHLRYLASHLIHLKYLDLSWCDGFTDKGLEHLSHHPNLERLSLERCECITNTSLQYLASQLTHLKYLDLVCCRNITDEGLRHLAYHSHLRYLRLSWCSSRGITDAGRQHLLDQRQLAGLKPLKIIFS